MSATWRSASEPRRPRASSIIRGDTSMPVTFTPRRANASRTWVLTAFLLVSAVATPVLGKLGDQYGKERLLVVSLALFFVGCVGAAASWNIWTLIAFRAVQGLGGAVFPLSFAIIRDEFPREQIGVAIGLISAVFGVGGGFGIVLAGLIVDYLSWRWLFVVGAIPVGSSA